MNKILSFIHRFSFKQIGAGFIVLAGLLALQQILLYKVNNYLMFSKPFFNLLQGKDLYLPYPDFYYDIYKYSPTFALLFAPFSVLPDGVGIVLWNLLNASVFIVAIKHFFKDDKLCIYALFIVLLEAITSLQNLQSNCLLSGLMILTYTHLQKRKFFYAAILVSLAAYIKIYGIAAMAFALFFKERFKFGFSTVLCLMVLFLSPLMVLNYDALLLNYKSWISVVGVSTTGSQMSVMGILQTWFGWSGSFAMVQLAGFVIVLGPLIQIKKWNDNYFHQLVVASILMFVVLFNQMAESPTYIIPLAGVAIWLLSFQKPSSLDISLLVFVLLLTSLSATDLFPKFVRDEYVKPYTLKALPVLVVWLKLQFQLWSKGTTEYRSFAINKAT